MEVSTGITVTGLSSFIAEVIDVTPPGPSRPSIDVSHQGSVNAREFTPGKLVDWGSAEFMMAFDPSVAPPINAATGAVVITFANSGASTWTFDGFMTNFTPTGPLEDKMTATATIKVTGAVAVVA